MKHQPKSSPLPTLNLLDPRYRIALAFGLRVKHPELSDRRIAQLVGISASALSRDRTFQQAKEAIRGSIIPRGWKCRGRVEATIDDRIDSLS